METQLRTRTVDLYELAEELREDDLQPILDRKAELEARIREEYDDPGEVPAATRQEFQQLRDQAESIAEQANTYEHYAEMWSGDSDDGAYFTLQELSGDAYVRAIDESMQDGINTQTGGPPVGLSSKAAVEFALQDVPEHCPPDPGKWPAEILEELYSQLDEFGSPEGVDLGNESLGEVLNAPADKNGDTPVPEN